MAVTYLDPGATSLAAGSWKDTVGFANSAQLVVSAGSATAFTGSVDFSGLSQGVDYFRVLPPFTGALQSSSGGPIEFDADQGTDQLVSYAASGGLFRYRAHGNSNAATNVENIGNGHLYLMGGTITNLTLCSGQTDADSSTVITNCYVTGGNNTIEYNATALTEFIATGGTTVLKRLANKIIVNSGATVIIDYDDGDNGTGTYGATSIEWNGGLIIWRNGSLDKVKWRGGKLNGRDLRQSATIGATSFEIWPNIEGYLQQPGAGAVITWSTATKRGSAAGYVAGYSQMYGS